MGSAPKIPPAPKLEKYTAEDFDVSKLVQTTPAQAQQQAVAQDRAYYDLSDADYAARRPDLLASNAALRQQVGREATASVEPSGQLPPAVQSELMRAGLGSQLGTFDAITPGSLGAYGVGRNLGVGALNYYNQARDRSVAERNASRQQLGAITAAEPQRSFGLTGSDALNLQLGNQGAINQANIHNVDQRNSVGMANVQAQNAAAQQQYAAQTQAGVSAANSRSATMGAGIGAAGAIGGALIIF